MILRYGMLKTGLNLYADVPAFENFKYCVPYLKAIEYSNKILSIDYSRVSNCGIALNKRIELNISKKS